MSLNLYAMDTETGEEIYLHQTPTWVTEMCLVSYLYDKDNFRKQRTWKDTRKIYLDWCYSFTQGTFKNGDAQKAKEDFERHRKRIMSYKKIKFYTL